MTVNVLSRAKRRWCPLVSSTLFLLVLCLVSTLMREWENMTFYLPTSPKISAVQSTQATTNNRPSTSSNATTTTMHFDAPHQTSTLLPDDQGSISDDSLIHSDSSKNDSLPRRPKSQSPPPPRPLPFARGAAGRYSQHNPFRKSDVESQYYSPKGGKLPYHDGDNLEDPNLWKYVDNTTCLFHKGDETTIYDKDSWQRRVPYALLLGVMKGGTHALMESLWQHPLVAQTKHWELHFYTHSNQVVRSDQGIFRAKTLQNYAKAFSQALGLDDEASRPPTPTPPSTSGTNQTTTPLPLRREDFVWDTTNPSRIPMVAIDSSPPYFQQSDRLPALIRCVTPWVKLVVLLRDPIARLESQYRFLDETRRALDRPMVDWETWIADDLRLLNQSGIFQASTPSEEALAWRIYNRRPNSHQIVGRGLYILSLQDYWRTLDQWEDGGGDRDRLYVIQSEAFRDPQRREAEYQALLEFLELPPHSLDDYWRTTEIHATPKEYKNHTATSNTTRTTTATTSNSFFLRPDHTNETAPHEPLPATLREQLVALYRPYNARLYQALGWDNVWGY